MLRLPTFLREEPGTSTMFNRFNLQKARPFMWEKPEGAEFLTPVQIETLTKQIQMLDGKVRDEEVAKLLQINMMEDMYEQIISKLDAAMVKAGHIKPKLGDRLASLKVAKN